MQHQNSNSPLLPLWWKFLADLENFLRATINQTLTAGSYMDNFGITLIRTRGVYGQFITGADFVQQCFGAAHMLASGLAVGADVGILIMKFVYDWLEREAKALLASDGYTELMVIKAELVTEFYDQNNFNALMQKLHPVPEGAAASAASAAVANQKWFDENIGRGKKINLAAFDGYLQWVHQQKIAAAKRKLGVADGNDVKIDAGSSAIPADEVNPTFFKKVRNASANALSFVWDTFIPGFSQQNWLISYLATLLGKASNAVVNVISYIVPLVFGGVALLITNTMKKIAERFLTKEQREEIQQQQEKDAKEAVLKPIKQNDIGVHLLNEHYKQQKKKTNPSVVVNEDFIDSLYVSYDKDADFKAKIDSIKQKAETKKMPSYERRLRADEKNTHFYDRPAFRAALGGTVGFVGGLIGTWFFLCIVGGLLAANPITGPAIIAISLAAGLIGAGYYGYKTYQQAKINQKKALGYELAMDEGMDISKAEIGKIYINDKTRDYVVHNFEGKICQGKLHKKIDLQDLTKNLKNKDFKEKVLASTFLRGHTASNDLDDGVFKKIKELRDENKKLRALLEAQDRAANDLGINNLEKALIFDKRPDKILETFIEDKVLPGQEIKFFGKEGEPAAWLAYNVVRFFRWFSPLAALANNYATGSLLNRFLFTPQTGAILVVAAPVAAFFLGPLGGIVFAALGATFIGGYLALKWANNHLNQRHADAVRRHENALSNKTLLASENEYLEALVCRREATITLAKKTAATNEEKHSLWDLLANTCGCGFFETKLQKKSDQKLLFDDKSSVLGACTHQ